jgi:hypothetical protein
VAGGFYGEVVPMMRRPLLKLNSLRPSFPDRLIWGSSGGRAR